VTKVIYKQGTPEEAVTPFDWSCRPSEDGETCVCTKPTLFFFPQAKYYGMPTEPTLFEVAIDPDDEIDELDESNNTCEVLFEPQTVGVPDDTPDVRVTGWSTIKSVYR
jgi:hypothetical protein